MKEEDKMDYTAVMKVVKQYEKASWYKDSLEWTAEDDRYLYQQQQQKRARKAILNWTKDRYKPTHFISIQLPTNYRSYDDAVSLNLFKRIIKNWERQLCGSHWIHHYIPFITFAENHKGLGCWHYHILFNQGIRLIAHHRLRISSFHFRHILVQIHLLVVPFQFCFPF